MERTKNKLNAHMASTLGFEPEQHWWEASALTTAPPLQTRIQSLFMCFWGEREDCGLGWGARVVSVLPMTPRARLNLTPNRLSPPKHINGDWVRVCHPCSWRHEKLSGRYSMNRTAWGGTSHSNTSNIAPLNSSPDSWIFTFVSVGFSPRFFLFTSPTGRIGVHNAPKYGTMPLSLSLVCKRVLPIPFLQTRFDFRQPLGFDLVPPREETSAGSFPEQRLVIEHTPRRRIHRL